MNPTESQSQIFKHPEWKRLYAAITPLIPDKTDWTYAELSELAGINIQTTRGRQQFYQFRRHLLKTMQFWMEVVHGKGYRLIQFSEHGTYAVREAKFGHRKFRKGLDIATNTQLDKMSPSQIKNHLQLVSTMGTLEQGIKQQAKTMIKLAAAVEQTRLEVVENIVKYLEQKEEGPM